MTGAEVCTVVWPGQLRVTVLGELPPLMMSSCSRMAGVTSLMLALVRLPPLNETLLLLSGPYGPESHQAPPPQSKTLLGYWPVSARLGLLRSSNATTLAVPTPGVGVAVLFGTGVDVGGRFVGVAVGAGPPDGTLLLTM